MPGGRIELNADILNPITMQWVGKPHPLGATYDGSGTNFALFSSVAEGVELCLFGDSTPEGRHDETRIDVIEVDGHIWHVYLPEVRPGQHYGWRVHGPWDPAQGLWCNSSKLLIDPYAKAIDGLVDWSPACFGYDAADRDKPNLDDSAPHVPLAVVSDPFFDWGSDRAPRTAMHETIIYEAHVRGLTMRHPGVPEHLRGTYSGVAHPAVIDHLVRLGVTAQRQLCVFDIDPPEPVSIPLVDTIHDAETGRDEPRRHRVDEDSVGSEIDREVSGGLLQPGLGRGLG